jgi:hypothetical protein
VEFIPWLSGDAVVHSHDILTGVSSALTVAVMTDTRQAVIVKMCHCLMLVIGAPM